VKLIAALACGLLLPGASAFAGIKDVVRSAIAYKEPATKHTQAVRVKTARVIAADYQLIGRDFPAQAWREGESKEDWHRRVDEWLIRETGFIGVEQTAPNSVNTAIATGEETKTTVRPPGYNRSFVVPVEGGMIDMKGVGTFTPKQASHGNGLATLGEMIREFLYEKLVDRIFRSKKVAMDTVGSYAVIDYGFDVIHADGSKSRAGAILRQAHVRSTQHNSQLEGHRGADVEQLLRRHGITSAGEHYGRRAGPYPIYEDLINIQGTNNPKRTQVVDFGAFLALEKYDYHARWGLMPLHFVFTDETPIDPKARVPLEQWGYLGKKDPKSDKPYIWSHELAQALAEGKADRSAVDTHFRNMLGPAFERLPVYYWDEIGLWGDAPMPRAEDCGKAFRGIAP
jgi:hypothetical protein